MNRRAIPSAVWAALDACAVAGDLHRSPLLDCIMLGYPVRGPLGGWGYSDGVTGVMRFPDCGSAALAVAVPALLGDAFP